QRGGVMNRVAVQPRLIQWARERAHMDADGLLKRFAKLPEWESGQAQPTFKQLQDFAKATHVPFGYLFLPEPPAEPLPIPDFRTLGNHGVGTISPDLRDSIYAMQRRQAWLREERTDNDAAPIAFIGSARIGDDPQAVGQEMRRVV